MRLWCTALCLAGCGRVAFEAYCPTGPDGVCEGNLVGPLDLGARPGDLLGMGIDWQANRLLVGMPGTGLAKVAERSSADATFVVAATLAASIGGPNTDYGLAVALDGDRAIVGAHSFDGGRGAAAIFERAGDGTWTEVAQIANPGTGADFASAVALRGDRALIGAETANAAYVFERNGDGGWPLVATLGPFVSDFGKNVVLDATGERAFVSATWDTNIDGAEAGSVRVFERSPVTGTWSLVQLIQPPIEEKVDAFGIGMAVDGNVLAIGGHWASRDLRLAGVVIVYARNADGLWTVEAILHDTAEVEGGELGRGVALRGDRLVATMVRDFDGVLAVFHRQPDGRWLQTARLADPLGELAGYGTGGVDSDLQVRMIGDTALVGTPLRSATNEREGAVVQYDLDGL